MSTGTNDPPAKKVEVSEAEVIDPHFRVTFPLPDGWDSWTDAHIAEIISNLSVQLKYKSLPPFINFSRSYDPTNFKELHAPFELKDFDDNTNYFDRHPHYLTLYICFPDKDFSGHNEDKWTVTIKLFNEVIKDYQDAGVEYQPKRNH